MLGRLCFLALFRRGCFGADLFGKGALVSLGATLLLGNARYDILGKKFRDTLEGSLVWDSWKITLVLIGLILAKHPWRDPFVTYSSDDRNTSRNDSLGAAHLVRPLGMTLGMRLW